MDVHLILHRDGEPGRAGRRPAHRAAEVSWMRTGSRVWQLTGSGGGTWYLKRHRGRRFHDREVAAYRTWVPMLGVFFTDEDDRPVQLRTTYSSTHPWQWPGGVADPGERPWETAVRECREETGIVVPGVFDGGRLTRGQLARVVLDPDEHDEVRALTVAQWS
ncbi:NUDIX hydrolase [Streptomyces sp. NPDC048269]|uniref:NUDIX hydrolase n=1 Tax=Streptomyces sp. NPDC048269 TaxID=3155753 RepID=UPI0034442A2F